MLKDIKRFFSQGTGLPDDADFCVKLIVATMLALVAAAPIAAAIILINHLIN